MPSTDLKCSRYLFINWKVNNVSVTSESTTNLHWGILCLLHELCFLVENLTHWTDTWKQGIVGSKNKIRTGLFLYKDYIYEIDKVFCENHLRHSRFILLLLYIKIAIIYDKRTRNKDLFARNHFTFTSFCE